MSEIKNTFTGGKMNKDLDERLLKNGEYQHALNVQVRTTDSDSSGVGAAGTVQNIAGNLKVGSAITDNWMVPNNWYDNYDDSGLYVSTSDAQYYPHCVGSVADEKNDLAYFFFSANKVSNNPQDQKWGGETIRFYCDNIIQVDAANKTQTNVVIDVWRTVVKVNAEIPSITGEADQPYQTSGWSEIIVAAGTGTRYRPGMRITTYDALGQVSTLDNVEIKAVDGDNLLLNEELFVFLNPSTNVYMSFDSEKVLNFPTLEGRHITGINVVDDFLMWTDGFSEPKKINVKKCIYGTSLAAGEPRQTILIQSNPDTTNSLVDANELVFNLDNGGNDDGSGVDKYLKEKHITVLKKAPRRAPSLYMSSSARAGQTDTTTTYQFLGNLGGDSEDTSLAVGQQKIITVDSLTSYLPNDILVFSMVVSTDTVNKAKFISYVDDEGEDSDVPTYKIKVIMVSLAPETSNAEWSVTLEERKPLFELKLVRFGYRYKYDDGEYSSFSPWSELAFLPDEFNYRINKGYNLGMVNTVRELIIKDFIPYNIPKDVKSVDVLYKTTDSPSVYIAETVDRGSVEWELFTNNGIDDTEIKTGQLTITSEMIHRILPENQTLRSWDNVPRYALSQEVVGNRLVFGNYTQGYDIETPMSLMQRIQSDDIAADVNTQPPHKSLKSIRDYKVGVVFGDKYGRETPVISPGFVNTNTTSEDDFSSLSDGVNIDKALCHTANSLIVSQNWEEGSTPDDWIDYVKYYVKETSNEYYNLIMDRWYDAADGNVWLSFNSADRNKVDEETYLLLKNKFGSHEPVLEKARYKIIAIENEAPDYIKTRYYTLGSVGEIDVLADAGDGVGGVEEGNTEGIWDSGQDANSNPPQGLMTGTTLKMTAALWQETFTDSIAGNGQPFGKEIKGHVEFRVVAKSSRLVIGSNPQYNEILHTERTSWKRITNVRYTDTQANVRIDWDEKWHGEANFFQVWTDSATNGYPIDNQDPAETLVPAHLVYELEFREARIQNGPEFDGRFFVKIEQDQTLASNVLIFGSGYTWATVGVYDLSYISSTESNEAEVGPRSGDTAWFSSLGTSAQQDANTTWFFGAFNNVYDNQSPVTSNTTAIEWEDNYGCPYFECGVLDYCGWGEHCMAGQLDIAGQTDGIQSTGLTKLQGLPGGFGTGSNTWWGTNCCSSIKVAGFNSNWTGGGYFSQPGGTNEDGDTTDGADWNYWFTNGYWYNEKLNETEFSEKANYGVFGSCTVGHNVKTMIFWHKYMGHGQDANDMDCNGAHVNAFIDGAKARKMDWGSYQVNGEQYQPGTSNFYTPKSMEQDGCPNGQMGAMTISYLRDRDRSCDADAEELWGQLQNPDTFFTMGGDNNTYKVISTQETVSQPRNFSYVTTKGYSWEYDNCSTTQNESGSISPRYLETCFPCDSGGPHQDAPGGNGITQDWTGDNCGFANWVTDGGTFAGTSDSRSGNDGYRYEMKQSCRRKTIHVRFRRVNPATGEILYDSDGVTQLGMDVSIYDPRGEMYHDGRDSIEIIIKRPVPVVFEDDNPNNELGACWETEPKEDTDLDLYYEASSAIPVRLTKDNIWDFAPIKSKIKIHRLETNITTGETELVEKGAEGSWGYRADKHVANVDFVYDEETDKDVAVLTIMSREPVDGSDFELHKAAAYNSAGVFQNTWYASSQIDIQTGDIISFVHQDGTITKSKVTKYYRPVDDTPLGSFNELTESEFNTSGGTGILGGPKAFKSTTYPSGFYGIETEVWNQEVKLPWFNCYAFGNGVESDRIRDDYNAPQIDNGVKVSTTFSGYGKEHIGSGMIYSGIYNSTSQVNDLNEFNMAEKITKELNPRFGSIQRLKARDTDMVVFTEDKVLRLLANKDALYNADGNSQLTASDRVLGTPVPFVGDYGISQNPESLAWDQFRMYFTDKQRGAVLRLSRDGLTPISDVGMRSWFRKNLRNSRFALGTFDIVNNEYNLTMISTGGSNYTLSFNEPSKGWVSFKSFKPSSGLSLSGDYYTSYQAGVWKHYVDYNNEGTLISRNNWYDLGNSPSIITLLFNDNQSSVKSFKSLSYEGSQARILSFTGDSVVTYTGDVSREPMTIQVIDTVEEIENPDTIVGGMIPNPTFGQLVDAPNPIGGQIIGPTTTWVNVTDNEYYNIAGSSGWWCSNIETDLEKGSIPEFKNKENKWFNYINGRERTSGAPIDTDQFTVQGIGQVSVIVYDPFIPDDGDCVPPCPSGYECINGICEEVGTQVYGCTNPEADNYNPDATVDDGSCIVQLEGCMDIYSLNYDPAATTTADTENCQPLCPDCWPYIFGCQDTNALNYNYLANQDGLCYYLGNLVPCEPVQQLDSSLVGYNGDAWPDASAMGEVDMFVPYFGASCLYEGSCQDGFIMNANGDCVPEITGCCEAGFAEYNPSATICDNSMCLTPTGVTIYGCTDPAACNYNPLASADDNSCVYVPCYCCDDETASNYFGEMWDNQTCLYACEGCCVYEPECPPGEVCGCNEENYELYNPDATMLCVDVTFDDCCGEFINPGIPGCMDDGSSLADYTIVTNYNPEATYDDGSCLYEVYGCTDPLAFNYNIDWVNLNLPDSYTVIDDGSCIDVVEGCMDETMYNYNPNANTECLDCCVPWIYGCQDETAYNYNPYANSGDAGINPTYASRNYDFDSSLPSGTSSNIYYDGNCQPWIYGCMDVSALNYAGPGNSAGCTGCGEGGDDITLSPPANTQYVQTFTPTPPNEYVGMVGGIQPPGDWSPGVNVDEFDIEGGTAVECETCNCVYIGDGNLQMQVRNHPGDSEATEEDVSYND